MMARFNWRPWKERQRQSRGGHSFWWSAPKARDRQVHLRCVLRLEALEVRWLLTYTITDLGTLGGATSIANGINANGDIVGSADTSDGHTHAFLLLNGGTMQDLGTLSGGNNSFALGINSSQHVAGYSEIQLTGWSSTLTHAFLYDGTAMNDLHTLIGSDGNSKNSFALALNNSDVVVGKSIYATETTPESYHAFVYDTAVYHDTTVHDLGSYSGSPPHDISYATAVDNSTTANIVGASQNFDPTYYNLHCVSWQDTSPVTGPTNLGTMGTGHESHAFGINASGHVLGDSATDQNVNHGNSPPHALLYNGTLNSPWTQLDLNVTWCTQSRAVGINASDVVVGNWNTETVDPNAFTFGFIWDSTNRMKKLSDRIPSGTGWINPIATAINDSGWIVGQGSHNGALHAFLLKPGSGPNLPGEVKFPPPPEATAAQWAAFTAFTGAEPLLITPGPVGVVASPALLAGMVEAAATSEPEPSSAGAPSAVSATDSARDLFFARDGVDAMAALVSGETAFLTGSLG